MCHECSLKRMPPKVMNVTTVLVYYSKMQIKPDYSVRCKLNCLSDLYSGDCFKV